MTVKSSIVSVVDSLNASDKVCDPPTPTLLSQTSHSGFKWVTTRQHNCKAKANTN